jgi:hypothetical protein
VARFFVALVYAPILPLSFVSQLSLVNWSAVSA